MPGDLTVRLEAPGDYEAVEHLTREAFWNVYRPGCTEHYLLHRLRLLPCYLKNLHFIALEGERVVGSVVCTRSCLMDEAGVAHDMITIGPVSVMPDRQRQGIGSRLIRQAMAAASQQGECAVFLYGDPAFYGRLGFRPASDFGITTQDGASFDAFQAAQLQPGALKGLKGRHQEDPAFEEVPPEALAQFDSAFPPKEKKKLPGQIFS